MKARLGSVIILVLVCLAGSAQACINDSKTLKEEQREHPTLAKAILSPESSAPNVNELNNDISRLKGNPLTNDPAWWNDLAGAYLRLGQPAEAVKLLEPLTNRFATNYGIHANLGTAYHLQGRYADAEKEIRRDLEIDPKAHFGLEKYHLALLQYLSRSEGYRIRHVYVDEFTLNFFKESIFLPPPFPAELKAEKSATSEVDSKKSDAEVANILRKDLSHTITSKNLDEISLLSQTDTAPEYSKIWDLASDEKLDDGVIYMASLNPKEPACWVMLGMLANQQRDLNLARAAYEKAIQLNSPQALILQHHIEFFKKHPPGSSSNFGTVIIVLLVIFVIGFLIALEVLRRSWRKISRSFKVK